MIGCDCAVCRSTDPRDRRDAAVDPDRARRRGRATAGRRRRSRRAVRYDPRRHVDRSARAGARLRRPPRRRDPLHAQPRRSRPRPRRGAALQRDAAGGDPVLSPTRGRSPTCGGCSRTSSIRRRRTGGGIPQSSLFQIAGPFSLGGVEIVPVPLMHGALPILGFRIGVVRLPDRLQRDSRRVVAAARRRAHAGPRRAARSAAPDAFQRRRGARGRRAARRRAHLLHAHLPRSAARRDLRAPARRRGVGL